MTNEEQRRNVMYSKSKDLDEAAKITEVLKSTHETGARKKRARLNELEEIIAVPKDTSEDEIVKNLQKEKKN